MVAALKAIKKKAKQGKNMETGNAIELQPAFLEPLTQSEYPMLPILKNKKPLPIAPCHWNNLLILAAQNKSPLKPKK